jgi:glycosyltransferase involved in cell wall biosynthesis
MATCNGIAYLPQQLASLQNQTLAPSQIVVCDDGSTDGTREWLQEQASKGAIRFYENPKRLGVVANFKKAVSLCPEDHDIALCDQDDIWLPDKLWQNQRMLRAAEIRKPGPALSFSDLMLVDASGTVYEPSFWNVLSIIPEKERLASLLFGNFITGCTLLLNPEMRQLFEAMPVTDAILMHDAWLGLIAFSFGHYAFSSQPLVQYRQHGQNVTAATNQRMALWTRVQQNRAQFRNNASYLNPEIRMAERFLQEYCHRLRPEHAQQLYDFCRLSEATWLSKKLLSLSTRSYRLRTALNATS